MYIASNGVKTAVILEDPDPISPRDPRYQDNLGTMVCWHHRYNLGDAHNYANSHDFARALADEHVNIQDVFRYIQKGGTEGYRLQEIGINNDHDGPLLSLQAHYSYPIDHWSDTGWRVTQDLSTFRKGEDILGDILDSFDTSDLLTLVDSSDQVAIMPLFLYDHSVRSMSTDSYIGRAQHAYWDSGRVGYIYMDKETAMAELAIAGDKIKLAQAQTTYDFMKIDRNPALTIDAVMKEKGYEPVRAQDILNPESHILYDDWLTDGKLYKKGQKLYVYENEESDNAFWIRGPVASFNPELHKVTEENWKDRAKEILKGEVTTYDNYLRGEIYGYQLFEGVEEVDSCWGFNPGSKDIRTLFDDMTGSWGDELKAKMKDAEYIAGEDFDIDDYLSSHDFPELRQKLQEKVLAFLSGQEQFYKVCPYGMSFDAIRSDQDGVLTRIADSFYEQHAIPGKADIHAAIKEEAGIARAFEPKITASDLEPGKDYTAGELMALLKKKPSLDEKISAAIARQASQTEKPQEIRHQQAR